MLMVRKLFGWMLQFAAGLVIVLALLVGVVRLLLPEASALTDDIKSGVQVATGFSIDFEFISAGASFYGPELRLLGVTLSWADGSELVAADNLTVSINLLDSIAQRTLIPGRILVKGTDIDALISAEGALFLQGRPWRDLLPPGEPTELNELPEIRLQLADIRFTFENQLLQVPQIEGIANEFEGRLKNGRINVSADIEPGETLGRRLEVEAEVPLQLLLSPDELGVDTEWSLFLNAVDFRLDSWLRLTNVDELPVIDSEGSVEARLELRGLQAVSMQTTVDLARIKLPQPSGDSLTLDRFEGELDWTRNSDGWLATGNSLQISRAERDWPESDFSIAFSVGPEPERSRYLLKTNFVRLDDLVPLLQAVVPDQITQAGIDGEVLGDLSEVRAELRMLGEGLEWYELKAGFASLGYHSAAQGLELKGYSGELEAQTDGGNLYLQTRGARFGIASFFRDTLDVASLNGVAVWRATDDGYRLLANNVEIVTPHGEVNASVELAVDSEFKSPVIDLHGEASMDDVAEAPRYLPSGLPPNLSRWIDQAFIAGRAQADFALRGGLREFPYDHGEGEFLIKINFNDGVLDYAPDWPLLTDASGQVVFDGVSMYSRRNALTISDIKVWQADVMMQDMRDGVLTVKGSGQTDVSNVLAFLQASPVGDALGPVFDDVRGSGEASATLELQLPIKNRKDWQLDANFTVENVSLGIEGLDPEFRNVRGAGTLHNTRITVPSAEAELLGKAVNISVRPALAEETDFSHRADVTGVMQFGQVWNAFALPATDFFVGDVAVDAQALFPVAGQEEALPFRLLLNSDMQGVSSLLPYPLDKKAEQEDQAQAELQFPERGVIDFSGSLQRGFKWAMQLQDSESGWTIARGVVTQGVVGSALPEIQAEPGLALGGYIDGLVLEDWLAAFASDPEEAENLPEKFADWQQIFGLIDLQIGELFAVGHRFVDVELQARPLATAWQMSLNGPTAVGELTVPFDITGEVPVELDMQSLLLTEPVGDEEAISDPRKLPALQGRIEEFVLDELQFGAVDLDVRRVAEGLKTELIRTSASSFNMDVAADWLVVDNAQRTRLHLELNSTDLKQTLLDLGYAPLLSADKARVVADLLWEGPPGLAMIYESTGEVDVNIRDGVINEVDTGGGRLLGLLSVTSLPRRLQLDFSDMTDDGLVFDKIKGRFRIDFGDAWTCNLGLEGPVADMGIVGRAGLLAQDYDQLAAVRPHVSNLAPVAGAFLAGPAVGVATLLITQIFKKPLSNVGETYFTLQGSWDDPVVTTVDQASLDTTPFADCESQLPELSPEEIQAIQELMAPQPETAVQPPEILEQIVPDPESLVN